MGKKVMVNPIKRDFIAARLPPPPKKKEENTSVRNSGLAFVSKPETRIGLKGAGCPLRPSLRFAFSPELEFGQPPDEGLELLVALGGQRWALGIRIYLRRKETNEQVQVVYPQPVRHDVKT